MIFLIRLLLCPFLLYVTGQMQMQSDCLILRRESKFRNFKSQENFSSWFIIESLFLLRMQTACLYRWSAVHSEKWPTLHTSTSWMRRKLLLQSGRYKSTTVLCNIQHQYLCLWSQEMRQLTRVRTGATVWSRVTAPALATPLTRRPTRPMTLLLSPPAPGGALCPDPTLGHPVTGSVINPCVQEYIRKSLRSLIQLRHWNIKKEPTILAGILLEQNV